MGEHRAEVAIVGAGVAGGLVAADLASRGIDVLVLESGPRVDREQAVLTYRRAVIKTPDSPYPFQPHAPRPTVLPGIIDDPPYYVQSGPDDFKSTYERRVGGTTWHWLGSCPRLLPEDFRMRTIHGIGVDWPIFYDDLEPWYGAAEKAMGVAGDDRFTGGSPRSTPFPLPPIASSFLDRVVADAASSLGLEVEPTPQARNSESFRGRPECEGNSSCIPICPIGAKWDASFAIAEAEDEGARVIDNSVVSFIEVDAEGLVTGLQFLRPDGSSHHVIADTFVIAAHGIETPKLLLLSAQDNAPDGVANSSDQVGRNLMDHPIQLSWALADRSLFPQRGPLSTSGIEQTRRDSNRGTRSAFRLEIGNDGWRFPVGDPVVEAPNFIERGLVGNELREAFVDHMEREIRFASLTEQLPEADNRVTLASETDALGLPRPLIQYHVGEYARGGMEAAIGVHEALFEELGASERNHGSDFFGAGHIMGTYRMGASAGDSVVDPECRSHDHRNLWLLGSGTFPMGGTANPTLTLAALALRAADAIATS